MRRRWEATNKSVLTDLLVNRDERLCRYCRIRLADEADYLWHYDEDGASYTIPAGVGWATIDHVVPIARGGTNDLENLVLACSDCNTRKGTKAYSEFTA